MGPRFDEVSTKRLLMRRWRDSDRKAFAALNADPEVMRHFPATQDRATSDALVDRIERRFDEQGFGLWALEVRATGEFIGFAGLNAMPDNVPGAGGQEVGWRLARSAWHHGYATEAGAAALAVGFDGVGLERIWSMTAVSNTPSQAVMQRLGMSRFTYFDHPAVAPSSPLCRHVLYTITSVTYRDSHS